MRNYAAGVIDTIEGDLCEKRSVKEMQPHLKPLIK